MIPTRIGQIVNGCTFATIMHTRREISALLVTPSCLHRMLPLFNRTPQTKTRSSLIHGKENTSKHLRDSSPAAVYCSTIEFNGVTDFYIPSSTELKAIAGQLSRCVFSTNNGKIDSYEIPSTRHAHQYMQIVRYQEGSSEYLGNASVYLTSTTVCHNERVVSLIPKHLASSLRPCNLPATVFPIRKIVIV